MKRCCVLRRGGHLRTSPRASQEPNRLLFFPMEYFYLKELTGYFDLGIFSHFLERKKKKTNQYFKENNSQNLLVTEQELSIKN